MQPFAALRPWATTLLIAGAGYFVDLFDLTLFGVVRVASLRAIGVTSPAEVLNAGLWIYNAQMAGLLIGGLMWGMLADWRGRRSVLVGSILLYSLASLASAAVQDVTMYAVVRFLAGLGLAGEVGAAIVLVSETLPRELRGLGTTVVTTFGLLGVTAAALSEQWLSWRAAYLLGGVLGLVLLLARWQLPESPLFLRSRALRGSRWALVRGTALRRLMACVAAGIPVYFTTSVMLTFSPEIAAGLAVQGAVSAGRAVLIGSIGLAVGDLLAGLLSQHLRRRKPVLYGCLASGAVLLVLLTQVTNRSLTAYYLLTAGLCTAAGYWAVLMTLSAEQFGTNVRGMVATAVPNVVRGSALFAASGFGALKARMPVPSAALIVGAVCFALAVVSLTQLDETFDRELDYVET